mmetsp:Transcript_16996/g.36617  ORF Transcript_16996/g.36617 Transcript_16996/m.36617 type:complete len:277 (-) Transcript_16996:932-1762(-)
MSSRCTSFCSLGLSILPVLFFLCLDMGPHVICVLGVLVEPSNPKVQTFLGCRVERVDDALATSGGDLHDCAFYLHLQPQHRERTMFVAVVLRSVFVLPPREETKLQLEVANMPRGEGAMGLLPQLTIKWAGGAWSFRLLQLSGGLVWRYPLEPFVFQVLHLDGTGRDGCDSVLVLEGFSRDLQDDAVVVPLLRALTPDLHRISLSDASSFLSLLDLLLFCLLSGGARHHLLWQRLVVGAHLRFEGLQIPDGASLFVQRLRIRLAKVLHALVVLVHC